MEVFDYVIVGGGSAGCVVANRLTNAGATVCVLEAGPVDSNFFIHMPVGFVKTLFNPSLIWQFQTEPTANTNNRSLYAPQGKTLGGSTSVNGMVFVRGQANDYNSWAQRGNKGWGYADVLPYFKRIEKRVAPHDEMYRGSAGNIPITDPDWRHPLCEAFIAGAASIGLPRDNDYNGATQEGAGYYQRSIQNSRRVSAAKAYLHPVMSKPNIQVVTNARATSILLEGKRAVGVKYLYGSEEKTVHAGKEVILCAGAINTPRLLQLSGIGAPELLNSVGIDVRHALPGVGENLSDHYSPRLVASVKNTGTINGLVKGPNLVREFFRWSLRRPSVLGLSAAVCYAFGRSDPALDAPDYTVIFTPASYKDGQLGVLDSYPGVTAGAWQMRPESTGYTRIRSADINVDPIVQPNYLSSDRDKQVLISAIRKARQILRSEPMARYYDEEKLPGAHAESDDELLDFARRYGSSTYHLAGSCRMGPLSDSNTVVDDELRVHGVQSLRIADSSVLPAMVSANTAATALMIGEKASDLLLGRQLAASEAAIP